MLWLVSNDCFMCQSLAVDIETESKDSHRLLGGLGDDMDGSRCFSFWDTKELWTPVSAVWWVGLCHGSQPYLAQAGATDRCLKNVDLSRYPPTNLQVMCYVVGGVVAAFILIYYFVSRSWYESLWYGGCRWKGKICEIMHICIYWFWDEINWKLVSNQHFYWVNFSRLRTALAPASGSMQARAMVELFNYWP